MHPIDKFDRMVLEGSIKDMEPIPKEFDYYELKYLHKAGYIMEAGNRFVAVII